APPRPPGPRGSEGWRASVPDPRRSSSGGGSTRSETDAVGGNATLRTCVRTSVNRNPVHDQISDSIGQYLAAIGTYPLLDAEEEVELAQAMEAGRDARERLPEATSPTERVRLERL